MSSLGKKATSAGDRTRSALPPRTDLGDDGSDVRFVPEADLALSHIHARRGTVKFSAQRISRPAAII
jgi:hypothetical protein